MTPRAVETCHPGTDWSDRSVQPKCNICGRFARWDAALSKWWLACVGWDAYMGGYEHD